MKIYIDASRTITAEPTGIENYSLKIILALAKLSESQNHQWILLTPIKIPSSHPLSTLPNNWTNQVIPGSHLWTLRHESQFFANPKNQDGVLFVPSHTLPLVTPNKTVITIHDLAFKYFPEQYGKLKAQAINHELNRSARKATAIITPSESTKKDIEKFYKIPPNKIHTINHGLNKIPIKEINGSYLESKYLLMVGRIEARKNTLGTLKAFEQSISQLGTTDLVIIGKPDFGHDQFMNYLNGLPAEIKRRVHILGHVSQTELTNWYAHALALVYPSFYEGFGFPILEAMQMGVPVITSDLSSMKEIAQDAALTIDPANLNQIAQTLIDMNSDEKLRTTLSKNGLARSKQFSWAKAAQETLNVLINC